MKFVLQRKKQKGQATIGELYIPAQGADKDGSPGVENWLCHVLEDKKRKIKVWGKTRIPAGIYKLGFRKEGRFYRSYRVRFAELENSRGMIHLLDVPNYKYILVHCGNSIEDTAGCLLVGDHVDMNKRTPTIHESTRAYERTYCTLTDAMLKEDCYIEIRDEHQDQDREAA